MSIAARLEIELERPSRTYYAGEEIVGEVVVHVREVVVPEQLSVELRWRTHGRGKAAAGKGITVPLLPRRQDHPAWEGGQTYRYAFRFTAPPWPPTLDGDLISVVWSVSARGSVGWRRVEGTREEVRILAQSGSEPAGLPRLNRGNPHAGLRTALQIGGVLVGMGGLLIAGSSTLGGFPLGCGGLLAALGLLVLWVAFSNYLAEQRLGPVHAAVSARAHPGGEVVLEVRFAPPRTLDLNRVTATLIGAEEVQYDRGDTSGTDREAFLHEPKVVHRGGPVRAGEVVAETVRWRLAPHAPFSFEADNNKVEWSVELHIDVPNWPDWRLVLPFEVSPVRVGQEAELKLNLITVTVQGGQRCPYCHEGLAESAAADLQTCAGCRAVFHRACLQESGSCTTRGCRNNRIEVRRAQAQRDALRR